MYYLGVDGGGTKTAAVLLDTITGKVRSVRLGSGNIVVLKQDGGTKLLQELSTRLLRDLPASDVTASTFAFAGAGRPTERNMAASIVSTAGYKNFNITTDAEILHFSFFADRPGILIVSGTGSVGLVVSSQGGYRQLGGWGYILGDDGSGFQIGRLAIRHILESMDAGRKLTPLARALLTFYEAQNPKELITRTYTATSPQCFVASCAQLVSELADQGDPDACTIADSAAHALAQLAHAAMDLCRQDMPIFTIALAGSVLESNSQITRRLKEHVSPHADHIEYADQQCIPAAAAVMYSAARCGHNLSERDLRTLSNVTLEK